MNVVLIVILVIILFILIAVSIVIYFYFDSTRSTCSSSEWVWDSSCLFFREISPDDSLKTPSQVLYLLNFNNTPGGGPSVCLPMWYKFKYVNLVTGGYSKASKWTTLPVQAGAENLPCNGKCPFPTGSASCKFNQPVIGTSNLDYIPFQRQPDGSFIGVNVHRYVGRWGDTQPPSDNEEGTIIGILVPSSSENFTCTDVLFNPCIGQSACNRCPNC